MTETSPRGRAPVARGSLPLGVGILIFIPLALLGNEVGAVLRYPEIGSALLFPPYALLTAALVASPARRWGWYILVATVAHAIASYPHWTLTWVLFADVGNVIRALVAALLLRSLIDRQADLDGLSALATFLLAAVLIAPAAGAAVGAANAVLHDRSNTYRHAWMTWFSSNALTAMTMLPGLLVATRRWRSWRRHPLSRLRAIEAVILGLALAITSAGAFLLPLARPGGLLWLLSAPLPLLIWAAIRFGHVGASFGLTAVTAAACWGADRGIGPFSSRSPDDVVVSLQLFMILTALPVLTIAAVSGARRHAFELHRALVASLHNQVAILDASGTLLEVNEAWRRFAAERRPCPLDRLRRGDNYLAACHAAVLQRRDAGSLAADAPPLRALAGSEAVLSGASRHFEMEYEHDDGRGREWYVIRIVPLKRLDGGAVITRTNVTARRRAQTEIEERRREVAHLARLGTLGQLSASLAHELRQPLMSILANAHAAQRLLQRRPVDLAELAEILSDIAAEDRRAAHVISGLRSMLRRGESVPQPVDTETLINEVLLLLHGELVAYKVSVTTDIERALPPALADGVQLQQVLLNLVLNACEAMAAGPAGARPLRLSAALVSANRIRLSVRDGGPGIPPELIDVLFDPFVTTKPDGMGLGLSISRTIAESHGARIWAENNAGLGTTIHCEWPTAADPRSGEPLVGARASPVPTRSLRMTML